MRELETKEVKEVSGGYSDYIPGILPYPIYPIPPRDETYQQYRSHD